jgi:hypothetical protein
MTRGSLRGRVERIERAHRPPPAEPDGTVRPAAREAAFVATARLRARAAAGDATAAAQLARLPGALTGQP